MATESTESKVLVYHGFGRITKNGAHWEAVVHGKAYATGPFSLRQRLVLGVLRKVMKASTADFNTPLFLARVREFLCKPEAGKKLHLRVGKSPRLNETVTRRSGHFSCRILFSADEVRGWKRSGAIRDGWLGVSVSESVHGEPCARGKIQLLEPQGVSVISDIDDTLKHTSVASRREMLANTFLREFERVPGMAETYQRWKQQGADFHYVSSSPWQLFPSLSEYFDAVDLPAGDFHLRQFQLRSDMLRKLLLLRRPNKNRIIASILTAFPQRQFVLVGDSVEHDPEIYAAIARRFPANVARILIRNVPGREVTPQRMTKTFRSIDRDTIHVFRAAHELGDALPLCAAEK